MVNTAPLLTGLASSVTFAENSAPQLLDANVTFTDPDNNFIGGTLVVSGLLPEDSVAIRNQGTGAGQIGFAAGTVSYGGVAIGTVTGGTAGTSLSVTFNASATAAAIDALIENLLYSNSSDAPAAARNLTIAIRDAASQTFTAAATNPFGNITAPSFPAPALADIDGDGDLDAVLGSQNGTITYLQNTGTSIAPAFTAVAGAASPFNGIAVAGQSTPALVDVDGDGDFDLVVGRASGELSYYKNIGTKLVPNFVEQTGADNPFAGIDPGANSAPAIIDIDGDGDLDVVTGTGQGNLAFYRNTGTAAAPVYERQTGTNNPFDGIQTNLATIPALGDVDGDGDLDLVLGSGAQNAQRYYENVGSPTAPSYVLRTGAASPIGNVSLDFFSAPALGDIDSDGDLDVVFGSNQFDINKLSTFLNPGEVATSATLTVSVTPENDAPLLTGVTPAVTFAENTVNSTPQLIDTNVTFTDPESNFDGGTLKVSGLLAEDSVAIRNQGTGAGQIGVSGGDVTYGGTVIGSFTGGNAGTDLSVTFNASASSAAIDALIENLTYANASNTPTQTRTLSIVVTDASGATTAVPNFAEQTGAANPFDAIDVGVHSTPTLADVDGDGDLDLVVGEFDGVLNYYQNTGTATAPVYAAPTASPFAGINIRHLPTPSLADVDGDGDLDLVVGTEDGVLNYYQNTGTATAPVYTLRPGLTNPFAGIAVGTHSRPSLADVDGDGDLDLVVGEEAGNLNYFKNTLDNRVKITVTAENDAPTLNKNTGLTLAEGGTSVITASKLGYSDAEQTDAQLVYTIITQTAGTVVKNGAPLSIASTFTQADIDGGLIEFRHDGSEGASAGFDFSLSDGTASLISSFVIAVTPVDDAPTAVTFSNTTTSVAENTSTLAPLKVADIGITDIDGGPNTLSLSGADAALFEIVAGSLFLKAGTVLDFETKKTYAVSVDVNDANLATTPDATKNFTLSVTDVNDAPTAVNFTNVLASIAENASTTTRIKVADIAIIDDALGSETITLAGADAAKFEIINGVLYIKAGTVLNFEADSSLDVTINVDDPTVGGAIDVSRALSVAVTDVAETINGAAAAEVLNGGAGADRIFGLGGNDTINGGAGNDSIVGGAGADRLTGGAGADTFIFSSITQSAYKVSGTAGEGGPFIDAGSSLRDVITDFTVGVDKIDVSLIDANENVAGNQAFAFRGTGNFAGTGSIVYRKFDNAGTANDHTVIYFDTTGDGRSDMLIALNGLKTLTAADFIL